MLRQHITQTVQLTRDKRPNLVLLWKKLQQLFEHFCIKLSTVPGLNHANEFLVFAERRKRRKRRVKGPLMK